MRPKFNVADRVFAKVKGHPYWPAIIVGPKDEAAPQSKLKYVVIFYGTGQIGVIKSEFVQPFLEKRLELGKPKKQKAFNAAMAEIESELLLEHLLEELGESEGSDDHNSKQDDNYIKPRYNEGDKVFAKLRGYPFWPARIVGPTDESAPQSKLKYEIVFYGSGQKAVVKCDDVQPFFEKRLELGKPKKQKAFNAAMADIESELWLELLGESDGDDQNSRHDSTLNSEKRYVGRSRRSLPDSLDSEPKASGSTLKPRGRKRKSAPESEPLQESQDTLSRSGRRTKAKKVLDSTLSTKTARMGKRGYKYKFEDKLMFDLRGTAASIPLDSNRPALNCPISCCDWHDLVKEKASSLRDSVLKGEISLDNAVASMNKFTKKASEEKRAEYSENDHQYKLLKIESKILDLDVKIQSCLTLTNARTERACKLIDELKRLPFTALMFKKHPQIVETVQRLKHYIGNTSSWSMSDDEKKIFEEQTLLVRIKAQEVYDKIITIFDVPKGQDFDRFFTRSHQQLYRATKFMSQKEFFSLIVDPTQGE